MPNLFSGINLALRALLSHQLAVEVTEHNVANANTPGYRRQEAVLTAGMSYPRPGLHSGSLRYQVGSGVEVDRIRRFNLEFYDGRFRLEVAESKRWEMQSDVLRQVEVSLAETSGDGLIPKLDAFWAGWQSLSSDPSNSALRLDLAERSANLAMAFNSRAISLMALRKDQDLAIRQRVEEINDLAGQVAHLNAEIANVKAAGGEPNDHLDERDRVLDRLAELGGAVSSLQENGEVLVSLGGHALVIGSKAFTLASGPDPSNSGLSQITWAEDGRAFKPGRGELAGLLEARDTTIPHQLAGLNQLAYELATRVNTIHQTGSGLNGNTAGTPAGYDGNFFASFSVAGYDPNVQYALEIKVDQDILDDPANIAAAAAGQFPGDGSKAVELAELKLKTVMNGGTMTLNGYYTGQISQLGLEVKGAQARAKDRKLVADALAGMAESVGGVSLDEEAANLVKAQRAYQAATRMLTAMDEMIDRIINGMGLVGR
jgi:flagellar hook-associated protein 1 FlgK